MRPDRAPARLAAPGDILIGPAHRRPAHLLRGRSQLSTPHRISIAARHGEAQRTHINTAAIASSLTAGCRSPATTLRSAAAPARCVWGAERQLHAASTLTHICKPIRPACARDWPAGGRSLAQHAAPGLAPAARAHACVLLLAQLDPECSKQGAASHRGRAHGRTRLPQRRPLPLVFTLIFILAFFLPASLLPTRMGTFALGTSSSSSSSSSSPPPSSPSSSSSLAALRTATGAAPPPSSSDASESVFTSRAPIPATAPPMTRPSSPSAACA
mmetsp:Transcript_70867/g.188567  ORF Transcript_70867/g.188567 Transcript_70867/m.188567 type:complete len:272 (-) Transcript_70867:1393-2208(-)